jgi:hypothetical protein
VAVNVARPSSNCKLQGERGRPVTNLQLSRDNFKEGENDNSSGIPDCGLTLGQTGQLTAALTTSSTVIEQTSNI